MSHQFLITSSKTEGEDDLARFDGIESIDGFNVTGGNLLIALETRNTNQLLNDVSRVEGKTPSLSIVGSVIAQFKIVAVACKVTNNENFLQVEKALLNTE